MSDLSLLVQKLRDRFDQSIQNLTIDLNEISFEVSTEALHSVCFALRDEAPFKCNLLVDLCAVDYLEYGLSEWNTERSTLTGFERGVNRLSPQSKTVWTKPRFAVVYHLLSLVHNYRVRFRVFLSGDPPQVPSIITIWPAANWYEREAFDLYGVLFDGHPDLRRLLTDYGFIGHPFRKDFPLTGKVEVCYDAKKGRVVYQPVTITPRTLVPKTIRKKRPNALGLYEKLD